jgi:glucose dehydrogenase
LEWFRSAAAPPCCGLRARRSLRERGLPERNEKYSTSQGVEKNVKGICPASVSAKDQQPSAYSPKTGLFYVPTNHLCMDYETIQVSYVAGQPYVGAIVNMYGADHGQQLGRFIAWDAAKGKEVWQIPERWALWSGALATAGDVVFYGTMDGMAKAVDAQTGKVLWQQRLPSGLRADGLEAPPAAVELRPFNPGGNDHEFLAGVLTAIAAAAVGATMSRRRGSSMRSERPQPSILIPHLR